MKNIVLVASVIFTLNSIMADTPITQEPPHELKIGGAVISPSKTADWTSASGGEIQFRFWNSKNTGIGFSIGVQEWDAVSSTYTDSDTSGSVSMNIEGSMTLIPVGISLLSRTPLTSEMNLVLDAGIKYMRSSSDILVTSYVTQGNTTSVYVDKVYSEDSLTAVFGIYAEGLKANNMALHLGIGYQIDITKPHESFLGKDIGTTSFSGAMFSIGLVLSF